MSSTAVRSGTKKPKLHPACPGEGRCTLKGCYHNTQNSKFSTDIGFPVDDVYQVNNGMHMLAAYPNSVRFAAGGLLYQRLNAASELGTTNVRGRDDEPNATIGTMVYNVQTKIREVSDIMLDRIRSCLSTEMPM